MLPWQQTHWEGFTNSFKSLHHAQMVTAPEGFGLREFCVAMSQYALCMQVDREQGRWCGECQSCRLFTAGSHPDFHVICNELEATSSRLEIIRRYSGRYQDESFAEKKTKPKKIIPIDQIRALIDGFSRRPHIAPCKVAFIVQADRLNINAANALLKLLEEPPPDSLLILLASELSRLPRTVLSRCVQINLNKPSYEQAQHWLGEHVDAELIDLAIELADGAPFKAKAICETGLLHTQQEVMNALVGICRQRQSPYPLSTKLNKLDFEEVVKWLQSFIKDIISWKIVGKRPWWHSDDEQSLLLEHVSDEKLFRVYDRLCSYRRIARGSLNEELALDNLFLSIQHSFK